MINGNLTKVLYSNENTATAEIIPINASPDDLQIIGSVAIAENGILDFKGLTFVTKPGTKFTAKVLFNYT